MDQAFAAGAGDSLQVAGDLELWSDGGGRVSC